MTKDTDEIDLILAQMRAAPPPDMPGDLVARIAADAARLQQEPRGVAALIAALGGWAGVGGLVAASAAGLWLGVAPPAPALALAAQMMGEDLSLTLYAEEAYFGTGG